ncbi:transglutaminase-like domain-containing protein [Methanohalophilus mahii]|uniref:Conserved repeat domain protein n=1 Tax=Methanohalophilus mahii (strain ATCC 35705 / DSM 5219 / SLP) TaxID=547558 RepID=D5E8Y2_METMS|nr:transglutaminase-like domain-containing protein [Methanohalophilus mahii]ADE35641.1 conserved repeat domain protein [Methanohalophilus mahii DSM 5219]
MKDTTKIISIILICIMITASFAGAAPSVVDNETHFDPLEKTDENPKLKLMHRSIDYDAAPLSSSYITPSYESQNNPPSESDLDLRFAADASIDILDSAEKNQYDPGLIYSFVHNYFEYIPYFGSLKGAHLTYQDREGNDADLASLTISLLRASDIPARYVYGTIELDNNQAMNYFGVENESVIVDMLRKNGISAQAVSGGIQFDHVWVEAYVDGQWVEFDPSFKQYNYTPGVDLMALARDSENYNSMLDDNIETSGDEVTSINVSGIDSSFTLMSNNFSTLLNEEYANKSNSEIFGAKEIIPHTDYYTLPEQLPYKVVGVHGEYPNLPDSFNHKLDIKLAGINVTLNTTELAGKRISVFYEPSTEKDSDLLNSSDNLSEVNALDINMSALLQVDGALIAAGQPSTLGSEQELEIGFIAPGGQIDAYTRTLQTGAYFVIGLALQPVSTAHMSERVERYEVTSELLDLEYFDVTKDELYGELLNLQALTFWGKYRLYNSIAAASTDVTYTRHPSVMLVGTQFNVTETNDTRSVHMNGVYTDIVRDIINPTAKDGDSAKSYAFLFSRGMTASSMEKSMLSLSYNVTAYSTSEIIKIAGENGIPILTLNSSNWDNAGSNLNISKNDKTIVENAVDSGYTVIIPRDEVVAGNFTGSVFIVFDPQTGASSYYGPNGKGWGWLDTLKTGLEAGVSAVGSVAKGTAKVIADTGGKVAGVATGVISTVGEAVTGTGSTVARVAKTAVTGAVNAAGYVVTTVVPTAAAGVTAATTAGLVVVTAFTADRVTELGKTVIDVYDAKADYEKSVKEYRQTQEEIKEKKEQIKKEELEQKREELKEKKKELEEKKEKVEEEEEIDLDKEKEEKEDKEDEVDEEEKEDEDDFPGDEEKPDEIELEDEIELDDLPEPEDDPIEPSSPGGDHPDDTFSVASSKLRNTDVTSLQIRNAYKKGYTNPVYLNEYRLGQLERANVSNYTDTAELNKLYELSNSQADVYSTIVNNYTAIKEELELAPDVLMLQKGFYASAQAMVENRGIPVKLTRVQDFAVADTQQLVHDTPILFLPSGSLYGLDSSTQIQNKLEEYAATGGTVFVMAQQHGYEYSILPHNGTRALGGAGWQEDQSCLYNAASIGTYHPAVSGQPKPTLTVNIDGYFTSYPENTTIILKRNKNSMPAMLAYDYYNGTVIATSVYDDWAYFDGASTLQGELLVRDVLAWAENPANVEAMLETDSIDTPVNITNKGDFAATQVIFKFTDPLGNTEVENTIDLDPELEPGASKQINFSYKPKTGSTLGVWNLDYILVNESDTAYTEYDARKMAIGKYVASDQGYSTTPDITYSIRSTNDRFAYGSDAVFTVTVWNNGDTDQNVTLNYCFPHHGWIEYDLAYGIAKDRSWYNLEKTLEVPAQGSTSFNHKLENVRTFDRLWSRLYDTDGNKIGSATLGLYCFSPKLDIEFDSGDIFKTKSNNTLNYTIMRSTGDIPNASIDVKIYDSKSNLVKRETTTSNITATSVYNGSIEFSPQNKGSYNFVVEVTNNGKLIGTNSQYILAKDRVLNLIVAQEPDFSFYETNNFSIDIENMEITNFSDLVLETSYINPDGDINYSDTTTFDIESETTKNLNVSIPFDRVATGVHKTTFKLLEDAEVVDKKESSFVYSPTLWTHLSSTTLVRDTEETLTVYVNNGDAAAELIVDISSDMGFQNQSSILFEAGERKNIEYTIPVESDVSAGSIMVELRANGSSKQNSPLKTSSISYTGGDSKLMPTLQANIVAGNNLTFSITNEGPADTSMSYSYYFLGHSDKDEIDIAANETLSHEIPVPMISSGDYNFRLNLQNLGTDRTTRQLIPVHVQGLDLDMSMEEEELEADMYIPVKLNNSGIEITVNLEAQLTRGYEKTVLTAENVTIGAGEVKVVELPLDPSLSSGAYSLHLSYENSSYNVRSDKYYNPKIEGLGLDFDVAKKEYAAGDTLDLTIDNTGAIDTRSNVTVRLGNNDLGTQQAAVDVGEQSVLTYTLPENLPTATFGLFVNCEEANSGGVLTFSKSIPVSGLEYSLELQPQTVKPGQNLTASVSNTGTIALSGNYDLSIYDGYTLIEGSSGQVSAIAPGETELLELEVPSTIDSGTYTFIFELTDQLDSTDSKTVSVYIPDASFEMTLDDAEYLQGGSIGVTANISNIENGSFTMSLFDGQDNTIATSPPEEHNASSGSVNLTFSIPEGIMSGPYVLFVEVKDQASGLSNSTSQSLAIEGINIEPHIETANTKYLEGDTIDYEVRLNHSGTLPQGDAYIKAYLQEDMGSSGEFTLESKYPATGFERFGDTLFIGTSGGLYTETGFAEMQPVENSELAAMEISGLDVDGNLLWILSDNTVYNYDPVSDMLDEVLVVEKQEDEGHQEGGSSLFAVDSSEQVIYMPNGWEGLAAYGFDGSVTYYTSENSPLGEVTDILVLPDEVLFVDYDYTNDSSSCHSLSDGIWSTYDSSDGLLSDNVYSAVSDGNNVYFITDAGISSRDVSGGAIGTEYEFGTGESVSGVDAAGVFDGIVYFVSYSDLYRYDSSESTLNVSTIFDNWLQMSDLGVGNSALWFCDYWNGLFTSDKTASEIGDVSEVPIPDTFSPDGTITGDSDVIVSADGKSVYIYDIASQVWNRMEVPVELGVSDVTFMADHIWIASDADLIGIDKNTGDISIFNESNSDYNESSVSLIENHKGDIWVLGGGGVSVYSISDGLSTASINSPDISDPEDITAFEEIVAVINSSGTIHEYNYMSDNVRTYETGITDWNGLELEYNQDIYWVLKTGGSELYSYNPATEETSGPEESTGSTYGLATAGEKLYAVADWLYIFDGQTWNEYTGDLIPEDSDIGIESAGENVLLYAEYGDGWITSLSGQGRQLVMDRTVQFADFSTEGTWQNTYIPDRSGQLTFEVEAVTDLKQITDQAKLSVDVYERDVSVALSTAKEYYRPDEPINATVRVSNNAPATFESELVSSINKDEIGREDLVIESGDSLKFEIPVSNLPVGDHTLRVRVGDAGVSRDIVVANPEIEVSMNVPEVVSSNPFTVELFANNPGNVTAKTGVTVTNLSIEEEFDLILAPGTSQYLALNTTIANNTTVVAEFTGDIDTRLTEDMEFGERAHIDTQCQTIYRPGTVEIPVNVTNTGQYKTDFNVSFSVNDTTSLHKSYILGINQSVDDVLAFDLAAGDYNLSADATGQIPVEFEKVAFQVGQTTGFELGKAEVVSGNLSFMVNLSNKQPGIAFNGTVEIITDFYESTEQVNLSALENTSIGHNISLPELTPGNYTLQAQLLESQEVIQIANSTFTIQAPEFTVAPSLNKQNVQPGEILKYNFTVSNTGSIGAMADMYLDVPGVYEDTLTSWIASEDSHNFSFSFKAPDDLAEGYYPLYYGLEEDNLTESRFYLEGANVTVNSWLDKRAYLPGENATLTMQVENNGNYPLELYSRVKYFDFDDVHEFTVDKNSTTTFTVDIPTPQTDNKVFISVYLDSPEGDEDSGRSLYINSDYIHDRRDVNGLRISTERQAYETGETVVMNVNVTRADNLTVVGPGLDYNGYIAVNTTIDFEVPNVLSGVYRYEITYGDATGQYLLDIHGFDLIVKAAQVGPGRGGE